MLERPRENLGNLINGVNDGIILEMKKKIVDNRTRALKKHNKKISQLKDGRYSTYVDDATKKDGRRKLIAPSYEELADKLASWYFPESAIVPVKIVRHKLTLQSLYPEWSRTKQLDGRSTNAGRLWYDWKKYCLDEELSRELINKPIEAITSMELKEWVHALNKKYHFEEHQYFNATSPVRQLLKYAEGEGYIKCNPYTSELVNKKKFIHKEKAQPETQVFFVDELEELWTLAHDGTITGYAICFMLKTGLRHGELLGLKTSDISTNRKYISVNRQYSYDFEFDRSGKPIGKQPILVEHPKTRAGERDIYLVQAARDILDEVESYNRAHHLYGEFVFRSAYYDDFHFGHEAVDRKLRRICSKMQTIQKSQHKLRKTFISTLLDEGINIDEVRRIAGHESEKTTLSNYCYNRYRREQTESQLELALAV